MKNFIITLITFVVMSCTLQPAHAYTESRAHTMTLCVQSAQHYANISKYRTTLPLEAFLDVFSSGGLEFSKAALPEIVEEIYQDRLTPEATYDMVYKRCIYGYPV